jgi:copper resistance protein B
MKTALPGPMKRMLLACAIAGLPAGPVIAQDHSMHMPMSRPMPPEKPAAKDVEKKKTKAPTKAAAHQHDGHAAPAPVAPPPATGHEGMQHDMAMPMPEEPDAPTEPITPIPVLTDADRAAAAPQQGGHPVHDNSIQSYTLFNRLEASDTDQGSALEWEGQAWIGTDLNRLWLRSEGERVDGRMESAGLEVLYGRSIATWWDVVAGIRHDFKPGASEDFAAIGVVGLAPYKFEVEATAYIGQSGQTAARIQAEYETLLTNRLILQPLVEVNLYGKDDPQRGIGSGLSTLETGLRLRYEVTRRFAPYIGIVREQAFGRTANLRRGAGEATNDTRLVAGIRIWF